MYKQIKSGEDLNHELNEGAQSSIDTHSGISAPLLKQHQVGVVKIFSSIESNYYSNLLKRKLHRKDTIIDDFTETSLKALRTLKALMHLLLLRP